MNRHRNKTESAYMASYIGTQSAVSLPGKAQEWPPLHLSGLQLAPINRSTGPLTA